MTKNGQKQKKMRGHKSEVITWKLLLQVEQV